ncbi:hypothetical protein [Pseudomonas silesiensis]|jgi:hypothetical protein|nr:hypothetical protein PS874_01933 [Pseudomonas fluorescens]
MRKKMDYETKTALSFIDRLSTGQHNLWPHDFEFSETSDDELTEAFGYWFGGHRWANSGDTFVQFGRDGTGSMFLLWYYPDLNAPPPVVLLGSEGERCLMATDIDDFIRQLGSGQLFFNETWSEPLPNEIDEMDWCELRRTIHEKYGLGDEPPEKIAEKARLTHPDFPRWVESMIEYE